MSESSPRTKDTNRVSVVETLEGAYQLMAYAGGSTFLVDEPVSSGGLSSGPTPHNLLSAALASCTAITLRLYINRKAWPARRLEVHVSHTRDPRSQRDSFQREVSVQGTLNDEQRVRLVEIAKHCPVHLILEKGADITTDLMASDAE